jgi:hypothetical protein
MNKEIKSDNYIQEEGEDQLSELIKQAGAEARKRRKKALDNHFKKIKKIIADVVRSERIH